jgi:hypothetical protein
VNVTLGKLALSGIEGLFGANVSSGVQTALAHYMSRLRSGLQPPRPPGFCSQEVSQATAATAFDVSLDPDLEQRFEHEARRHGASREELVAHAVFVYLADVDRAVTQCRHPVSW